jgi:hypothetical protein
MGLCQDAKWLEANANGCKCDLNMQSSTIFMFGERKNIYKSGDYGRY